MGAVIAGTLLAEVGDPGRFPSEDHFASYCGAAPVKEEVDKMPGCNQSGGNRRLNWALHVIAIVRLRVDGGRSKQFVRRQ